jgi:competence protein ComEC
MLAAAAGQLPGFPVVVLNTISAPLLAYIAQIAAWCGRPGWAYLHVELGIAGLMASYGALAAASIGLPRLLRNRRIASLRRRRTGMAAGPKRSTVGIFWGQLRLDALARAEKGGRRRIFRGLGAALGIGLVALTIWTGRGGDAGASGPATGLRVSVLDVGQGDAILLQPAAAPAVLVDGGPPGDGLAEKLHSAGVQRLGVAIVTHEQSDHAGGIEDLFGHFPVAQLAYARLGWRLRAEAEATGAVPVRIAEGGVLRSGRLRVDVLWPPPELLSAPLSGADPNNQALVLLVRWRSFSMLLSADAEAEAVPLDPGPIDVLKLAHHGSEDAGLAALLDRTATRLAVISVGEDNPYGHPAPSTLAVLAAHGVPVIRTDRAGTIVFEVDGRSVAVETGS